MIEEKCRNQGGFTKKTDYTRFLSASLNINATDLKISAL